MITPEPPAGSEHYREGWRHGYEQAAIDRERSADAVRLAADTGQAREQILQRDITFGEYIIAVCDAIGLPHDSPRAAVVEAIRAAVAAAQAPESPTDSTPKAGSGGSSEAETASGGRAPDVAAPDLDRWLYETFTRHGTAARWARLDVDDRAYWTRKAAEIRALLGTDTTPKAGRG